MTKTEKKSAPKKPNIRVKLRRETVIEYKALRARVKELLKKCTAKKRDIKSLSNGKKGPTRKG